MTIEDASLIEFSEDDVYIDGKRIQILFYTT